MSAVTHPHQRPRHSSYNYNCKKNAPAATTRLLAFMVQNDGALARNVQVLGLLRVSRVS